jgi:hypothetical protein
MPTKRYSAAGEEVVLRHKEDRATETRYGNHAAWFDDGSTAIYLKTAYGNKSIFPDWIESKMSEKLVDATEKELKCILSFLADNSLLICKCGRLYPKDNAVSTGFAGNKCKVCASDDEYCSESESKKHEMRVVSGRNNARKATVKKCKQCGHRKKTPPTG